MTITAKLTPEQMTYAQGLFDYTAAHLFRQGEPARVGGVNFIQTPDGKLKDPIGALLEEDEYDPTFESQYLKTIAKNHFAINSGNMLQLLARLQMVHDADIPWLSSEHMACALNEVSEWFNLDASILGKVQFRGR
jgi:hypothetical protein